MKTITIVETTSSGTTGTVTKWMGGFGHWLKDKQKEAGLTSKQLSEKSTLSPNSIARYRRGELPSVKNYLKLTRALGEEVQSFDLVPKSAPSPDKEADTESNKEGVEVNE